MAVCYVLGMHRSGTSFVASYLNALGVVFDLPGLGQVSQKHHEYSQLNDLNDNYLRSWKRPCLVQPWFRRWVYERRVRFLVQGLSRDAKLFGIKDPRLPLVFEFWARHSPGFKALGVFRRPLESAHSLQVRTDEYGHAELSEALDLWKTTNQELLRLLKIFRFPLIDFNAPSGELAGMMQVACEFLEIPFSESIFRKMYRKDEKHHNLSEIPENCLSVYEQLQQYYQGQRK
jgi:hypothetical protein